jgi:hypothetical protein
MRQPEGSLLGLGAISYLIDLSTQYRLISVMAWLHDISLLLLREHFVKYES